MYSHSYDHETTTHPPVSTSRSTLRDDDRPRSTCSCGHSDTKSRGAWDEEYYSPPRHLPAVSGSYPSPLIESLPKRRSSNPAPPSPPPSAYHQRHSYDRHFDEDHRVIKHETRARHQQRSLPHASMQSPSSYRSTSNSSVRSFISNEDNDEVDQEEEYDDDDEEEEDLGEEEEYDDEEDRDDVESYPQSHNLSELTPEMYEDFELHSDVRHMLHMLIPANAMGCLIGSRGAIIRKINAQTKCTLSVRDPNTFSVKDDRVLRIYGKAKGICLAQHLVIEKIRAHRAKKGDPNYTVLRGDELLLPLPESAITKSMSAAIIPSNQRKAAASSSTDAIGSLRWLLPVRDVGKVIGQGGAILSSIARDSGTKIHITAIEDMPRGSTERAVTISGSPKGIEAARRSIEAKAGGRSENPGFNGKCGQYFAIPFSSAGALIGIQGTKIRQIADKSGARLQIPSHEDLPLGSVNRTLHIQGNKKQIETAYAIVRGKLRKEMHTLQSEAAEVTIKIVLSTRIAAFLLEQHGRLIREISEKSGAHAHFLPPHDDETRLCVIKGEMAHVFRAERLILQFIAGDAIAMKRSGGGSISTAPRERKRQRKDLEDPDEDEAYTTRAVRSTTIHAGSAKRGRYQSNEWRSHTSTMPDNRRVKMVAKGYGNAWGEPEIDILDRLTAPLQSARHGSTAQNASKRQRR